MMRFAFARIHTVMLIFCLLLVGCGNTSSGPVPSPPSGVEAPRVVALEVSPVTSSIPKGTSVQLHATALLSDGNRLDVTSSAQWISSDPQKLSVTSGLATALAGTGTVSASASFQNFQATTSIRLSDATLQTLRLDPPSLSLPRGATGQVTAIGTFSDGSQQEVTSDAVWTSGNPTAASVLRGLVTALAPGTSTIQAEIQGRTAQLPLTVSQAALLRIELEPQSETVPKGLIRSLRAFAVYTDSTRLDVTEQCAWSSLNGTVVAVSNLDGSRGQALAVGVGHTRVKAVFEGQAGEAEITVTPAQLVSILITPPESNLPLGLHSQFSAEATFSDHSTQSVTGQVTWKSSRPEVLNISNADGSQGLATALSLGTTSLTARLQDVEGSASVTVGAAVLVGLKVSPDKVKVTTGASQAYSSLGTFSDGSTQDLTSQVAWLTSDPSSASISLQGVLTGLKAGSLFVRATGPAGVQAEAAVTVNSPTFRDKLWVGEYEFGGQGFKPDLVVLEPTTMHVETPSALNILIPDAFSAYDAQRQRVYVASSKGLNVLDAGSAAHLLGSPYHAGATTAGSKIFPVSLNGHGFAAFEVAYDGNHQRVYLATSFGLYAFEAATMQLVAGSPFPASAADVAATGVCYDSKRNRVYLLSSENGSVSGDNNVIAVLNGDTLVPIAGSPFIPPGIQTLMYGQLMFDQERGKLYTSEVHTFTEFDVEAKTFTVRSRQGFSGGGLRNAGQIYVPEEDLLAMVDFNQNQLEVYRGDNLQPALGSPILLPDSPRAVAYDSYTRRFFVTTAKGIEVIDAVTGQRLAGSPFVGPAMANSLGYYLVVKVP